MKSLSPQWIDTPDMFQKITAILCEEPTVAVDLESDSLFHYPEKICLIQIATRNRIYLVDPIALSADIPLLAPVFSDPGIRKILHGSDYDIRSLHRDFGIEVENLVDTEVACRFLGLTHSGLDSVLQEKFQVKLDKRFQKKDWSSRPLSPEMREYAARDVQFLIPLAELLISDLRALNRMEWFAEECRILSRVRYSETTEQPRFMRIKGAGRLSPRSLAVLEMVLEYREEMARKKDRPPFKIIGNSALMDIAKNLPADLESLDRLKVLSSRQMGMYGQDLIERVNRALRIPPAELPVYFRNVETIPENGYTKRLNALKEARTRWATSLSMDPGFICSNALLHRIAVQMPLTPVELSTVSGMKTWQIQSLGKEILEIIRHTSSKERPFSGSEDKVNGPQQA